MNILLTSFDPFGTDSQNSSLEILNRLPDHLEELQIRKEVLPTQFIEGPRRLLRLLDEQQPDLLLMLGQAGGTCTVLMRTPGTSSPPGRMWE